MKGGRILGRFEGIPTKGGYFLGQTGGAIQQRRRLPKKIRSTLSRPHRALAKQTLSRMPVKQTSHLSTRQVPGVRKRKMVTSKRHVVRKRIQRQQQQQHKKPLRKVGSLVNNTSPIKEVKETLQDIVSKKLNNLGKAVKQEASQKLIDLSSRAGERAVNTVVRRGKRVLEDVPSSAPAVKRRRLNPAPVVSYKKGYLSGTKQYGGSRLF